MGIVFFVVSILALILYVVICVDVKKLRVMNAVLILLMCYLIYNLFMYVFVFKAF